VSHDARRVGRPRRWRDPRERQRHYRERKAQKVELVETLIDAVYNASLDDPRLRAAAVQYDRLEVLRALIAYYEERNFNRWPPRPIR
jgi:hypothetical protein